MKQQLQIANDGVSPSEPQGSNPGCEVHHRRLGTHLHQHPEAGLVSGVEAVGR
ncbi:hypothetical protein [Kitasatospora sp. P5_F3]